VPNVKAPYVMPRGVFICRSSCLKNLQILGLKPDLSVSSNEAHSLQTALLVKLLLSALLPVLRAGRHVSLSVCGRLITQSSKEKIAQHMNSR
jgi:hypothetical protein